MSHPKRHSDPIKNGSVCPYCGGISSYEDSAGVYHGRSYGMIYICHSCKAYVGVHKGTNISLGRLADSELRKAKIEAHDFFNKIFKLRIMTRKESYSWLSEIMGTPLDETHIGMFDVEQCKEVVYYSKQLLNDNRRLDLDMGANPQTPYYEIN